VRFDPLVVPRATLDATVRQVIDSGVAALPKPATHEVEVRYGGEDGPDLDAVAALLQTSPASVVRAHVRPTYTVTSTGFLPGFVYLGELAEELTLPRREQPRSSVPAGSVAIAERQTGIYGVPSAGGWWLIGRATAPTFDPGSVPPTRFAIGDSVVFREVKG
jgi:inhibitor of KinA